MGGQPGEHPAVLIGSIFYSNHKIVKDPIRGEFSKGDAENLIKHQEEMSDKTGSPSFLDVVGSTSEALVKYVDFVAGITDLPFLVDGSNATVRINAMKHAMEIGLQNRVVYNSINWSIRHDEIDALKELRVKSAIVIAFNPKNPWPEGRIEVLRGTEERKGLLKLAKDAGIKNTLVDTAVTDLVGLGLASKAVYLVKNKFGVPAGCAPANAITTWNRGKGEFGRHGYDVCIASSCSMVQMAGANLIMYGPIEWAGLVFPPCAMIDGLIAYTARKLGTKTASKDHPLYKIF